jgi:hypothetical protein
MKEAFDGWWYDPGSSCGSRCLVYSLGAPFGAGPAAAGVGLELQLDVSAPDPGQWAPGQAWLAGSLWPSPQALAAAWNSSRANNSSSSGDVPGGADAAALELLSSFHLPSPSERQLLLRTVRVLGRQAVLV